MSETWAVTQELKLDELINAKTVSRNSPEISAVWNQLQTLNRSDRKRVGRALACRADRLPGTMDRIEVRTIWALIRRLGFRKQKTSQTRSDGNIWTIEPIELS